MNVLQTEFDILIKTEKERKNTKPHNLDPTSSSEDKILYDLVEAMNCSGPLFSSLKCRFEVHDLSVNSFFYDL